MKSKKAEAYIDSRAKRAEEHIRSASTEIGKIVLGVVQVIRAVEIAERDAEERMREKAVKAFCSSNCPNGCSFGGEGGIGCGAKYRFIQKLKNDESKPTDQ